MVHFDDLTTITSSALITLQFDCDSCAYLGDYSGYFDIFRDKDFSHDHSFVYRLRCRPPDCCGNGTSAHQAS